jgi:hypothetical protein
MVNNVYERSFSWPMHMIQNACNLRYKDAYTSCYICHAKSKNAQRKLYICYKGAPIPNSRNQTHTKLPPANEWKLLDLGVLWKYRLVGHVWVHGSRLSSLSLHCLSENYTLLLCAWFWKWSTGFFATLMALMLSHWSGTWVYSSQSHSWCMWSKGVESNN